LKLDAGQFKLEKIDIVYTEFQSALSTITQSVPGKLEDFMRVLQHKLDEQLETPPRNETLEKPF